MDPHPKPSFASKRKGLQGQVLQQVDMFDQLSDPLLQITGRKGRIKWANSAAYKMLGGTLVDRRLNQFLPSSRLRDALKKLKKKEEGQLELIVQPKNLSGREFRVRLARLEKKTVYGGRILVSLSDVTEVMRLQKQRADFIANASHELKTPIASLLGFIETLEQDAKALPVFLPMMAKEAKRMRDLIANFLDLTKTEQQADSAPTQWIKFSQVIPQCLEALQNEINQRNQDVSVEPLTDNCLVRGDPEALVTAFTNLLQNASKYSPDESTIFVRSEIKNQKLHVTIEDQGIGIEAKHIPRITERFYRVDDGRDSTHGSVGLGLAIVKHILIRHQAELTVESDIGKGSNFIVSFPCKPEPH